MQGISGRIVLMLCGSRITDYIAESYVVRLAGGRPDRYHESCEFSERAKIFNQER